MAKRKMRAPALPEEREALGFLSNVARASSRRTFLKWSGITVGVAAVAACSGDSPGVLTPHNDTGGSVDADGTVHLGSGDLGILNYALALEQLEAAFYQMAVDANPSGLSADAMTVLDDLRKHEAVHRDFLFAALGSNAIPQLDFDFSTVDFTSGDSVLQTAKVFEDLGVSAYNGAGQLLANVAYLVVAGKIVSVEARHAAAIRDLLSPKSASFAGDDVVDANGLDVVRLPADVLPLAAPFVNGKIDASQLPTT